jgi:hypothetical protein
MCRLPRDGPSVIPPLALVTPYPCLRPCPSAVLSAAKNPPAVQSACRRKKRAPPLNASPPTDDALSGWETSRTTGTTQARPLGEPRGVHGGTSILAGSRKRRGGEGGLTRSPPVGSLPPVITDGGPAQQAGYVRGDGGSSECGPGRPAMLERGAYSHG